MLTLKFYAGGDDAPPRLPVRVLSGVTDVRVSDENPPRLVYSTPSVGLVSRGRDDVEYLPLNGAVVEVFNAAGVSLAHLNAGPEVLYVPSTAFDGLTADELRRMRGDSEPTWPVGLTPPGVIDTVGGFPALALALQSEGYSFGSLTKGFGWWFGKWAEAAERGECGAEDTLRQAILGAEEHYRDRAEREPGDVGAAMRTRAGTILERARREDCIAPHKPLHARRIPLDLARPADAYHDADSLAAATPPLHSQSGAQQGLTDWVAEPEDVTGLLPAELQTRGYTLTRQLRHYADAEPSWHWRFSVPQGLFIFRSDWRGSSEEAVTAAQAHNRRDADNPQPGYTTKVARRIFPPVPAEDWLTVDCYPANWLGRGERLAVMVEDDAGNVGRAFRGADGTWWQDLPADATPEQLDFDPVRFSYLPAPHRFACRTCFAWMGQRHVEGCPNVQPGQVAFVLMGDTPPAERAPVLDLDAIKPFVQGLTDQFRRAGLWANLPDRDLPTTLDAFEAGKQAATEAIVSVVLHGEPDGVNLTLRQPAESDIADLTRPLEGTNDTPEPAPTVPFFVNGEQYDTTAGVRSGRALYDRVGDLSGQMLVAPDGSFVGDTDLVDIQGGETFATTPYRDPILRPEPAPSADPAVPPGHVVVTLNGMTKAVDPVQVTFVDDLWRVLQLSQTSGLKVNKPGQVTRPLPDPNAAYKLEKGDAFESYLCERRFSRAAPVQVTVDGSERLLTPGVYERQEIDALFGCAGWDLTQNGKVVERGASVTVGLGDRFSTDIPF